MSSAVTPTNATYGIIFYFPINFRKEIPPTWESYHRWRHWHTLSYYTLRALQDLYLQGDHKRVFTTITIFTETTKVATSLKTSPIPVSKMCQYFWGTFWKELKVTHEEIGCVGWSVVPVIRSWVKVIQLCVGITVTEEEEPSTPVWRC